MCHNIHCKMVKQKTIHKRLIIFITVCSIVFCFNPSKSFAAMLLISPSSGTYKVGDTIKVSVDVSSYTKSINAVSGTLFYPKDSLAYQSISINNSLINQWLPPGANGPVVSVSSGSIHFEGVLFGGYEGAPKTVFTVNFKVKKTGTAKLNFENGTILANDGLGTNITEATKNANYKLAISNTPVALTTKNSTSNNKTSKNPSNSSSAPQVVTITPETNTQVQAQNSQSFSLDYYTKIIISGFGILVILVLYLLFRIARLTRIVTQLQVKKRVTSSRRTKGYSLERMSPKNSKRNLSPILKNAINK